MTRPVVIIDTHVVVAGLLTKREDSPVARVLDGIFCVSCDCVGPGNKLAKYLPYWAWSCYHSRIRNFGNISIGTKAYYDSTQLQSSQTRLHRHRAARVGKAARKLALGRGETLTPVGSTND